MFFFSSLQLPKSKCFSNLILKRYISKPRIGRKNDKITWYGWGSCDQGQLGLGHMRQVMPNPTPLTPLNDLNIVSLSVGLNHTLALTPSQDVYSYGYNLEGQLGVNDYADKCLPTPVLRMSIKKAYYISAGPLVSFIFTDDKNTRAKEFWKVGLTYYDKHTQASTSELKKINLGNYSDAIIKEIRSGQYFSILLDEMGQLYSIGYSEMGGLGLGKGVISRKELGLIPKFLNDFEEIVDIKIGWGHVLILTSEGNVYSWGSSMHGQCGHNTRNNIYEPQLIEYFKVNNINVVKIAAGSTHSLAIDNHGNLYVWGSYKDGKLGLKVEEDMLEPTLLSINNHKIINVAAGCDHSVVLTENNDLYSWGFGQHGALGHGDLLDSKYPKKIPKFTNGTIVDMQCGMDVSIVGVVENY